MSQENNPNNEIKEKKPEGFLIKGWRDFMAEIDRGYKKFQNYYEEQAKKNQEAWNANKDRIIKFFDESKRNWDNTLMEWGIELEKLQNENKEQWNKNKENIENFFRESNALWDSKLQEWKSEINRRQSESLAEWDARKQKISEDIKAWQEDTKKKWEKGLKAWRKEMIKGSYLFLVFMIPILLVFFVIVALINWLLPN
ncbi:MAG: hypothetical protein EU531_06710 [Promethearchaeota archaeon]|nr:MAG: hypothetical protein EU531_06710 [Candidatus Lokiarchaeota archaeon]